MDAFHAADVAYKTIKVPATELPTSLVLSTMCNRESHDDDSTTVCAPSFQLGCVRPNSKQAVTCAPELPDSCSTPTAHTASCSGPREAEAAGRRPGGRGPS